MRARCYLDNAGTGIPSDTQMEMCAESLKSLVVSNPHSHHATSQNTASMIENLRSRILTFLGTHEKEYAVVFTSNTTQSLKLVAECFDYNTNGSNKPSIVALDQITNGKSTLLMLRDSHTSVVGMREYKHYEQLIVTNFDELNRFVSTSQTRTVDSDKKNLFVLTAKSNFCGRKYDLNIIEQIKKLGGSWSVCLDAAAWIATSPLDLSEFPADFVAFSFYKLFGYPTGIGALIIRRSQAHLLNKRFIGGGTVEFLSSDKFEHRFKKDVEKRFEDGTLDFYSIVSLRLGFDDLQRFGSQLMNGLANRMFSGGIKQIEKRCLFLAKRLYRFLTTRKHFNGQPIAVVYGDGWKNVDDEDFANEQGDIVNFNLVRDNGSIVGYIEVEKMCDLFEIELRTGCMCNQGACSSYLNLSDADLKKHRELGKVCDDEVDMINGQPLGSVRISFGRLNDEQDVERVEQMINLCFVNSRVERTVQLTSEANRKCGGRLRRIFVYPIKSASAISANSWTLSRSGLKYDRHWLIASVDGVPLTQKKIENEQLVIRDRFDEKNVLRLPLHLEKENAGTSLTDSNHCIKKQVRIVKAIDCGNRAAKWLQSFNLPIGCRLIQTSDLNIDATTNFSNQAEYLLVTTASIRFLAERTGLTEETVERRFRANLVIETENGVPFEEDDYERICIGSVLFTVTGKCTRCQMICVDQETGDKDPNLLLSLRDLRSGKVTTIKIAFSTTLFQMTFGVYLSRTGESKAEVVVGSFVHVERKSRNTQENTEE
ncbi:Molybdenum cofactor sulfurase [Aphelenchoides besseyi]|nr:Molybdenum cofactor sulfurase [Aphelenchoides besseyi]